MNRLLRGALLAAAVSPIVSTFAHAGLMPYSVQSVRAIDHVGFIELVGPGKVEVQGRAEEYSETVFLNVDHIVSMSRVFGVENACVLEVAAPNLRESVSVLTQTCNAVLKEIARAR